MMAKMAVRKTAKEKTKREKGLGGLVSEGPK